MEALIVLFLCGDPVMVYQYHDLEGSKYHLYQLTPEKIEAMIDKQPKVNGEPLFYRVDADDAIKGSCA